MRCGIYVRVSTNNQVLDGESLDEQEKKLINYCKVKNWDIVKIYREEGQSGKDLDRPKFKELIKDIEKGVIDTVVIKKIDRLSRSILDFEKTYKFFEKKKINLISLQENFDTSTARRGDSYCFSRNETKKELKKGVLILYLYYKEDSK